jgi:hypothetical protein
LCKQAVTRDVKLFHTGQFRIELTELAAGLAEDAIAAKSAVSGKHHASFQNFYCSISQDLRSFGHHCVNQVTAKRWIRLSVYAEFPDSRLAAVRNA